MSGVRAGTVRPSTGPSLNQDTTYALNYHEATKHSEISIQTSAHYLDWANKPSQFKIYEGLASVALPRNFPRQETAPLSAISGQLLHTREQNLGLTELSELLYFSAGLTRKYRFGSEIHYMRAASATGALYPIELYVVAGDVAGLEAGVYHFDPLGFQLSRIRAGDHRPVLAQVSNDGIAAAPATIAFTSLAWKNAWKYEARSYRHWFWDGGVIAANLIAVSSSIGLRSRIVQGFVDQTVNDLLGLRDGKEATILLSPVGPETQRSTDRSAKNFDLILPKVRSLSNEETEYAGIWEAHRASFLRNRDEVDRWTDLRLAPVPSAQTTNPVFRLAPPMTEAKKSRTLGEVILQRGSSRRFDRSSITFSELSTVLRTSTGPILRDYLPDDDNLIDAYLIANAVEGLAPGSYFYAREHESLEQLNPGEFRQMSAYLCLGQPLFGDASVVFFLMTRLRDVLGALGNRGYRTAQFEGGIVAGKIYLSAYSLGLGASGSTFYDDAVSEFFSPHAKKKSTMIVVGLGVPAYKARSGRVLPQFT
ncbi:MAG TPA: SagB family peptide dehydrogenase [Candidatus Angelobacter sp.]|nr:SagB family peptide dehydrogenase [Candidatus Angelobacter sp.]